MAEDFSMDSLTLDVRRAASVSGAAGAAHSLGRSPRIHAIRLSKRFIFTGSQRKKIRDAGARCKWRWMEQRGIAAA